MAEQLNITRRYLNQFRNRNIVEISQVEIDMSPIMTSMESLKNQIDDVTSKLDLTNDSISNIVQVIPPSNAIDPRIFYSNKETPTRVNQKTFLLSNLPDIKSEHLYLNGMLIKDGDKIDYTIADNTIIFSEDIPEEFKVSCTYYYTYNGPSKGQFIREVPTGSIDGVNQVFQLTTTPLERTEHVYLNGILQEKHTNADYILNKNILTFSYAPLENSIVQITYEYSNLAPLRILSYKEIPSGDINGINKIFTLNYTPTENSEHIYLNGVLQEKNADYIIENNIIVFSFPILLNDKINCTYYYYP